MNQNRTKSKITILSPAYNEAQSLPELIERISLTLTMLKRYKYEIIIVDDGSTDKTIFVLDHLKKKYPHLKYISHFRNHGKSLALMQGFDCAQGDILITMDADLQDIPEQIPEFVSKIEEGYDLVTGWRINRKDPWRKKFVSNIFNSLTAKLFHCYVHDINCGFKAYKKSFYKKLELRGDLHRLIPAIAQIDGFKVTEIPIKHAARKHGTSKFRLLRHRGLLDVIVLSANRTTQIRPFHAFSEVAFVLLLLGFLILITGLWGIFLSNFTSSVAKFIWINLIIISSWFIILATLMPFFGFLIDTLSAPNQGKDWRSKLIKNIIK